MSKTKISISLIKKGIPIGGVVKNPISTLRLPNGNTLYYKSNHEVRPKWLDNFFGEDIVCQGVLTKSASAVILYELNVGENESRIFAVCFGFGRSLLESNVIEKRFGLLVTLNSVDPKKLRSVDINSLEAVPLNNRIQSSALSGISNFNIDVDKDLLKSITGKADGGILNGTLSGADSLSVSTDNKYDEMDDFLIHCYYLYKSEHYKEDGFEWIDQIQGIKDTAIIEHLKNRLVQELNSEHPDHLWTSIPEIVDYGSMNSFRLKSDTDYDDLSIETIKAEYNSEFNIGNLKSRRIKCFNSEGNQVRSWSVYQCLYFELNEQGRQYLLNDGKWYEVAPNYVHSVKEYYTNTPLSELPMLDYEWRTEEEYNKNVCEANPDRYFLMDRDLVGQGGSKIEFCDIYTRDRQFVHVKKYSGSSVLSHLFFQGSVSAHNFFDLDFRKKVNQKLRAEFKVPEVESIQASDYEVVFAIAKDNLPERTHPDIPFFSIVSFKTVATELKRFGFKVSIKGINRTYVKQNDEDGGNEQ